MITLNNNVLKVEISPQGAEIRRVLKNGEDRMWTGNPEYWEGVSPLLFPICSALINDRYTYNGKEYKMPKHGFIRHYEFEIEKQDETSVTLLFSSNEETLRMYPWQFNIRVKYTLIDDSIKVEYDIDNKSKDTMYYSIGSHESYHCPEGIEEYDIIFEKNETLKHCLLDGMILTGETQTIIENSNVLPLKEEYFDIDALIFKNINSRKVSLVNRNNGRRSDIHFPFCEYMLIWQAQGAPFVCIEPWEGICCTKGDGNDITKKEGIVSLVKGGRNIHTHTISFK